MLSCTTPVLMDSGETVLTLPLQVALCRALHDLANETPFAIRQMDGGAPLVESDGENLGGVNHDLKVLLISSADRGHMSRPPVIAPSHPADAVELTVWPEISPTAGSRPSQAVLTLFAAINLAATNIQRGFNSGMIEAPSSMTDADTQSLLLWQGDQYSGLPALVALLKGIIDSLNAAEKI